MEAIAGNKSILKALFDVINMMIADKNPSCD
jgi:hypothetical protein